MQVDMGTYSLVLPCLKVRAIRPYSDAGEGYGVRGDCWEANVGQRM